MSDTYGIANYIYSASDEPLDEVAGYIRVNMPETGITITDNYNPVESLTTFIIEEWRVEEIRRVGAMFVL
jgi:hypothetical protein